MSDAELHPPAAPRSEQQGSFSGWRMVLLATFVHSSAYGVIFGGYGVRVLAGEERCAVSRATATSMLSVMVAVIIFSAPLLGALYARFSLRKSFLIGAALSVAGYLLLASSNDSWVMIATYALFIGPAAALMGSMAANVLVTRWFSGNQGKAFGLVNLPLGMMVVPIVAAHVLEQYGLQVLYLVSALARLV